MKKGFIFSIVIFLVLLGAIYYFDFFGIRNQVVKPYQAVPNNAGIIIEVNHFRETVDKLSTTDYYEDLQKIPVFNRLFFEIGKLDTLLFSNALEKINQPFLISSHSIGETQTDYLYVFNLVNHKPVNTELLKNLFGDKPIHSRQFKKSLIHEVQLDSSNQVSICQYNNLLIASFTPYLVEYALVQLTKGQSALTNKNFKKIKKVAGANYDLTLFVHYGYWEKIVRGLLNEQRFESVRQLKYFAEWTELDFVFNERSIYFNGYTAISDTQTYQTLRAFQQKNSGIQIANVTPKSIALTIYKNIDPIESYLDQFPQDEPFNSYVKPWIDGEWTYNIYQTSNNAIGDATFYTLKSKDTTVSRHLLRKWGTKESTASSFETSYQGMLIRQLPIHNFLSNFWGTGFEPLHQPFYTTIDNYIFFANSLTLLKEIIHKNKVGSVLSKDPNYLAFSQNLSDNANYYVYLNSGKMKKIIESRTTENRNVLDLMYEFSPAAVQFTYQKEMFFTNGFITYSQQAKNDLEIIWSAVLDAPVSAQPTLVKNHYTNENELLVQDENNKLYLLNNDGKIIWKRKITGTIKSNVYLVDYYKNNKLQYLFNTRTHIYSVDRNGNDVASYPIKLSSKASNGLMLVDYDQDKKYRYFIACQNGTLFGYNIEGEALPGWNPKRDIGFIRTPLQHALMQTKDYLVTMNSFGTVYFFNRKGELRVEPIETGYAFENDFYIDKSSLPYHWIAVDTGGIITRVSFEGKMRRDSINIFSNLTQTLIFPEKNDPYQYAFLDKHTIITANKDFELVFQATIADSLDTYQLFSSKSDNETYLGAVGSEQSYLYNSKGELLPGFPIKSASPFDMVDLYRDGRDMIITTNKSGNLVVYQLK